MVREELLDSELAQTFIQAGLIELAIGPLERLCLNCPSDLRYRVALIFCLFAQKKPSIMNKFLQCNDLSSDDGLLKIGKFIFSLNDAEIISDLLSWNDKSPSGEGSKDWLLSLASELYEERALNSSSAIFEELKRRGPQNSIVELGLGLIHCDEGRTEEGCIAFGRCLEIDSGNPCALFGLSISFWDLGLYEDSLQMMEKYCSGPQVYPLANLWRDCMLCAAGRISFVDLLSSCSSNEAPEYWIGSLNILRDVGFSTNNMRAAHGTVIRLASKKASTSGLWLEFGVRHGATLNTISTYTKATVHGFDSFDGLPEKWHKIEKGTYTTFGLLPKTNSNCVIHQGLIQETLQNFLLNTEECISFIHIDVDLYSSARFILEALGDRLVPGTIILFDQFLFTESWWLDEFKAFEEFRIRSNIEYKLIYVSPITRQAVVQIL